MKETYAASDADEPGENDMVAMMQYVTTGTYVADTSRQAEAFGTPPDAAEAGAADEHPDRARLGGSQRHGYLERP